MSDLLLKTNKYEKVLYKILRGFFPHICIFCGKTIIQNNICCDNCQKELIYMGKTKDIDYIDFSYAAYAYSEYSRRPIFSLKYGGRRYLAEHIAKILADFIGNNLKVDMIVPVPLHKKRLKSRGFNQAELMAAEISELLNTRAYSVLERLKATEKLSLLTTRQRQESIENAFAIKPTAQSLNLAGKSILLIDDILTTGATLRQCAKVLRTQSPKHIYAVSFLASARGSY